MSDMRMSLFSLVVLLAMAAGCTDTLNNGTTPSMDVVQQADQDPTADLVACETHADCSPSYCVAGFCNGPIDPKDIQNTEDVVEDSKSQCDSNGEADSAEEITEEPECSTNIDCDDKDACYEGTCHWGTCSYTLVVECGEKKECYETAAGGTGCAYTCKNDEKCEEYASVCNSGYCENGFCQFEHEDGDTCEDGDACTTGDYCFGGECNAGEQMDCPGECQDGVCQDLCQVDADCVPSDDPCENTTCDFNNKLGVNVCNNWYVGEAKFCDLPNGDQGKCYNFECVEYECSSSDHCDDGDACTQDLCTAGQCVHEPQACECQTNYECNDFNPCTDDICLMGSCQNPANPGAVGNACAAMAVCQDNGVCAPVECIADSDCVENDDCLSNACVENQCVYTDICGDPECDTDSECDDGDECTTDTCSDDGTCSYEDECFYGDFGFKSLTCDSDADCAGSSFGEYCVESELNGEDYDIASLTLCQPCYSDLGENWGCGEDSTCMWGVVSSEVGLFVSDYFCEEVVCESNVDCDDGDPCTYDSCHVTFCYNRELDYCFYCDSDTDCESNSWCDNGAGGVHVEYPSCEPDGTCQVDYWTTFDEDLYECNNPLSCDSDADCPMDGVCMISTCIYQNVQDDFLYPECNDDSQCEFGDCNFETGECVEWECYGVDNGDGTLSIKLCPATMACQDNECISDAPFDIDCSTNTDCALAGQGNYCLDHVVTGENTCYQCDPDSDTGEGFDHGCTLDQPFCGWHDDEIGYECVECYSDAYCDDGLVCNDYQCQAPLEEGTCNTDDDCGPWQECNDSICEGYGPVYCHFECPEGDIEWQNVIIFHGADEMTTKSCGDTWTIPQSNLCLWGEQFPTFSFNLNDGVWEWGGGLDTTITCNYPTVEVPDPTLTDTPGVTKGDLGVNLVTVYTDNACEVSD